MTALVATTSVAQSLPVRTPIWRPAFSLCQRELVRFLRQRNRIVSALATPILFWILLGFGIGNNFKTNGAGGEDFLAYFYPGTVVMILLFTAIFSTISIIEDRREGFLQSVLVAPVSREAIVLGKILGGTILATGQGIVLLLLSWVAHVPFHIVAILASIGVMFIVSFGLTGLGFCIAWRMSSTQGFHAIMMLFLMPLWFLSGAMFPPHPGAMAWIMGVNPLTYGVSALRRAMYWDGSRPASGAWAVEIGISVAFALLMFFLSGRMAQRTISADLQ